MQLSIITITFNAANVLDTTLKSIYSQWQPNVEHWIIDGGSTDGTLALAQQYAVQNVISATDKGIYDAMNKGLAKANGKYIWFLNAGDAIAQPNTLARLLQELNQNQDIYYTDTLMVNAKGQSLGLRSNITPHRLPERLHWRQFKYGMLVCHQSFIVKKELAPYYNLAHHYSADIDWEINCLKQANSVQLLPFVLSKYLAGGFSVKNLKASLFDRFLILKKHFGLFSTIYAHFVIIIRGLIFALTNKGKYW
jgi:glycosyltransferase involved in cell wall biosynthesis